MSESKYNSLFNIFLVIGMAAAVTVTTIFKLQQPQARVAITIIAGVGAVMGVVNTVLSANGNILTFLFGLIDVSIASYIYFDNGIMGNFALHAFYFLPMQLVGWLQWRKRGARASSEDGSGAVKVKARRLDGKQWALLAAGFVGGTALVFALLLKLDQAALSSGRIEALNYSKILLDAVVVVLNILGQVLLSFAFMEQWIIWNLVNVFSIMLWTNTLLSSPASGYTVVMLIKYIFYLMNSINGLRIWIGLSKAES